MAPFTTVTAARRRSTSSSKAALILLVEREEHVLGRGDLVRVALAVRRHLVNRGPERLVLLALGGANEHIGRDGEAWVDWGSPTNAWPQEVPLPDDLPA